MKFVNMNVVQFKELVKKQNKYHAKKTTTNGITFDSKKESQDWLKFCQMEACGLISDLKRQVKFVLQPAYVNNQGKKIREISYYADFTFVKDGKKYAVDSKSEITKKDKTYRLKRKMFEYIYQDYIFTEA